MAEKMTIVDWNWALGQPMKLKDFERIRQKLLANGKQQQFGGLWGDAVKCPCCGSHYGASWDFLTAYNDPTARSFTLCLECFNVFEEISTPIYGQEAWELTEDTNDAA